MRWPFWKRRDDGGANTPGAAVSAYLDGEVTPAERAQIETELAAQPDLASTLDAYREAKTLVRAMAEEQPRRSFALTAEMVGAAASAKLPERVHAPKRPPFLLYAGQAAAGIGVLGLVVAGVAPMFSNSSNDGGDFAAISANKDGHDTGEIMSTTGAAGGNAPEASDTTALTESANEAPTEDFNPMSTTGEEPGSPPVAPEAKDDDGMRDTAPTDATSSSLEMTAAYAEPPEDGGPTGRQIAFIVFGLVAAAGGGAWLAVTMHIRNREDDPDPA